MAEGKCFSTLRNAVHFFSDPLFARRVGFRVEERTDFELEVDRQVAQTLWVFLVVLIGEIALTFFLYQTPPVLFVLLTHPTEKVQDDAMKRLRQYFEALENLEAFAHGEVPNDDVATFVANMFWPAEQWAREVFIALLECSWSMKQVRKYQSWVLDAILKYSRAHWSSLIIEQSNNRIRAAIEHESSNGASYMKLNH